MSTRTFDPELQALRGRIGGLTTQAKYGDRVAAKARRSFLNRFLEQVDKENPGLPEGERQRRADLLLRAHMARLALKSKQARSRRKQLDAEIAAADSELRELEESDERA